MFLHVCVILFTGAGSASVHAGIPTPQQGRPPRQGDPPGKADPPPAQCMLGDTVNKWVVCILLECNSCFSKLILITVCQQSCEKIMFSVMCLSPVYGEGALYRSTIPLGAGPHPPDLFCLDLTVKGPFQLKCLLVIRANNSLYLDNKLWPTNPIPGRKLTLLYKLWI